MVSLVAVMNALLIDLFTFLRAAQSYILKHFGANVLTPCLHCT